MGSLLYIKVGEFSAALSGAAMVDFWQERQPQWWPYPWSAPRLLPRFTVVILCSDGMKHLFWLCLGKLAQNILSARKCPSN